MTAERIKEAAYRAWKQSFSAMSFETWLEQHKSFGKYWGG